MLKATQTAAESRRPVGPLLWLAGRTWRFWSTLALMSTVMYLASYGPVCWLVSRGRLPLRHTSVAFWPLIVESEREFLGGPEAWRPLFWWASVWDDQCGPYVGLQGLGRLLCEVHH